MTNAPYKYHDWEHAIPLFVSMTAPEIGRMMDIDRRVVSNYAHTHDLHILTKKERYDNILINEQNDKEVAKVLGITSDAVSRARLRRGLLSGKISKEAVLQKKFARTLCVSYNEYVKTAAGIVDVLTEETIYEIKDILDTHSFHVALGQLFSYSHVLPGRKKVMVCRKNSANGITKEIAAAADIDIIEFSG